MEKIKINLDTKLSVIFNAVNGGNDVYLVVENKPTDFWDSVKHFKRAEFACKCGGKYCNGYPVEMSYELVSILDSLREIAESPIYVSSGIRCTRHNANVGGVENSYHKLGRACDFRISGETSTGTINLVKDMGVEYKELYAIDTKYVHIAV